MNCSKKNNRGFTLLETLIVLAIMGIMAAIAVPNVFTLMDTIRVSGAAKNLASEMMLAKFRAISENNKYIVTFDVAGNSFSIYDDNDNDSTPDSNELDKTVNISTEYPGVVYDYVPGTKETSGSSNITSSVSFTGTPKSVIFSPDGTSNKSGSAYLILTKDLTAGKTDRMRAVTVITTGRIKAWKYNAGISPPWE